MSLLAALIGGGLAAAGGITSTLLNNKSISDTNDLNESLMRESWAREDNAVQRRVSDLKAAGLSPTLAAGSAAAASGPIQLKSKNYNGIGSSVADALSASAAVKSLEKIDIENQNLEKQGELLDKQISNYGLPDWYIAGTEMFGADNFKNWVKTLGDKAFTFLDPNKPSVPESPTSSVPGSKTTKEIPGTNGALKMDFSSTMSQQDMGRVWSSFIRNRDEYVYSNGDLTKKGLSFVNKMKKQFGLSDDDAMKIIDSWYNNSIQGYPGMGQGGGGGHAW